MKRFAFFAIVFLCLPLVSSVSSDLRDTYAPRETMIGELSGGILSSISNTQVRVVRDNHLDVAVQFDVVRVGQKQYVWMVAPAQAASYTIIIRDIVASVNGVPEIVEYRKDFAVSGASVHYSIVPGVISAQSDFDILATVYSDSTDISVDFPETRTVSLFPGTNRVHFSIANVIGTQQRTIVFGDYTIPALIAGAEYICGDGRIDGRETCDGANLHNQQCTTVPGNFSGGELRCMNGCLVFDTTRCTLPEIILCEATHVDVCADNSSCIGANGFWYNNSCHRYEANAVCDTQHVTLCTTQGTCLDSHGYWYNNSCNTSPAPTCGIQTLDLCTTAGMCLDAHGYWYNNSCHAQMQSVCGNNIIESDEQCDATNLSFSNCTASGYGGGNLSCNAAGSSGQCSFNVSECFTVPAPAPVSFHFLQDRIRRTILINGDLSNKFSIHNRGDSEIRNLRFDYNPEKFFVEPVEATLGVNQTMEFNVTLRDQWRGSPVKGVIVAYSEDTYEYLFLEYNFTNQQANVITEYLRNDTTNALLYCAEISGLSCGSDQTCSGDLVHTLDISNCCVGTCQDASSGASNAWIGYLIAGIVLLVGLIVYFKFKKTGKGGNPLGNRVNSIQKNLP